MTKQEVLEKLNQFIERNDLEEELPELVEKFKQMTEDNFKECYNANQVYHTINGWTKPRTRKQTTSKTQTYLKLNQIDRVTEKAYGVVTGSNCMHGSNYREFVEWIPASQTKEIDGKVYIAAWIVSKNNLWQFVDKESKITV